MLPSRLYADAFAQLCRSLGLCWPEDLTTAVDGVLHNLWPLAPLKLRHCDVLQIYVYNTRKADSEKVKNNNKKKEKRYAENYTQCINHRTQQVQRQSLYGCIYLSVCHCLLAACIAWLGWIILWIGSMSCAALCAPAGLKRRWHSLQQTASWRIWSSTCSPAIRRRLISLLCFCVAFWARLGRGNDGAVNVGPDPCPCCCCCCCW